MTEETQIVEQNPFTEDVQPVQVGNLSEFLRDDRGEWTQDDYLEALKEAIVAKGLSQWAIGMFMYEIREKWKVGYDVVAAHLGISYISLQNYTSTYAEFVKYRPDFMPPDEYSYSFLRTVANLAKKQGKDPAKELERLADKGIMDNPKAAYKDMKEEETGQVLPVIPKLTGHWDQWGQKIQYRFNKSTTEEAVNCIDWEFLFEQVMKITGKKPTV